MKAMAKIFVLFLLLCSFYKGGNASYQQCKLSDLSVTQAVVPGHAVGGYREYAVAVTNRCACNQINVKVACPGFSRSVRVRPAGVLSMDGDGKLCTLKGRAVGMGPGNAVMFSYSWRSQISFKPVSSAIACSAAPS